MVERLLFILCFLALSNDQLLSKSSEESDTPMMQLKPTIACPLTSKGLRKNIYGFSFIFNGDGKQVIKANLPLLHARLDREEGKDHDKFRCFYGKKGDPELQFFLKVPKKCTFLEDGVYTEKFTTAEYCRPGSQTCDVHCLR